MVPLLGPCWSNGWDINATLLFFYSTAPRTSCLGSPVARYQQDTEVTRYQQYTEDSRYRSGAEVARYQSGTEDTRCRSGTEVARYHLLSRQGQPTQLGGRHFSIWQPVAVLPMQAGLPLCQYHLDPLQLSHLCLSLWEV